MKSDNQLSQEPDLVVDPDGPRGGAPGPDGQPGDRDRPAERETSFLPLAIAGVLLLVLGLRAGLPLILMILGVIVMITIHELGHFLTAKWAGMKVTEFFIGFGPKLWSFRRGETEYGFKAVPAGAYVRIIGMNNLDEVAPEDEARAYRQQSFPKRLAVVLAGPATHLLQAFVILFVMFTLVGVRGGEPLIEDEGKLISDEDSWFVESVTPDSAAEAAGLRSGDRIAAFDGEQVRTWADVQGQIGSRDVGDQVTLTVLRSGEEIDLTTELGGRPRSAGGDPGSPFLGVGPDWAKETIGPVEATGRSITATGDVMWQSLVAMGSFFSPEGLGSYADTVSEGSGTTSPGAGGSGSGDEVEEGGDRVLSILGVLRLGSDAGANGLDNLLPIFLMITVFVGLINLVPLLPFDGGHAVVAIYERVRSRNGQRYHADVTKLLPVAYAVVMGLVILGVTSLYLDIVNPI
jgi:membrane-associated protease RseP (regulator of RpoE activity)